MAPATQKSKVRCQPPRFRLMVSGGLLKKLKTFFLENNGNGSHSAFQQATLIMSKTDIKFFHNLAIT